MKLINSRLLFKRAVRLIRRHNEILVTVPIAVIVALTATNKMAENDLMVYDLGIFQKPFLALAFFLMAIAVANIGLYMRSMSLYNFSEPDTKDNSKWKHLSKKELTIISVIYRLVYFSAAIYLLGAV